METRANYVLIGIFTLAAIAAMFGFATWFAGSTGKSSREEYRIVFSGSVSGLSRGASVLFNGLRVGEVQTISLLPEDPRRVVALIEVDPSTPMRSDTRARLEFQGLTGVASIQLTGGEPGSQPLAPGPNKQPPTIFADRSDFQDIVETVQRLSRRVDDVINRAERLLADNEGSIGRTVRNVETFTQALAANSDGIGRFLEATTAAGERIASLSTRLEGVTNDLDAIIKAIEPERVARIVANVETFSNAVGANRAQLEGIVRDASTFMQRINESATRLDQLLADANGLVRRVNPDEIESIVREASAFSRRLNETTGKLDQLIADAHNIMRAVDPAAVNRSIANIDRVTTTIGSNSQQIDSLVKDASAFARRANDVAGRLDLLIGDANNVVRSIDPALVTRSLDNLDRVATTIGANNEQIDRTLKDFSDMSARLSEASKRVDGVLASIERFFGTGPEGEAKGMMADISAAARSFRTLADNLDKRTAEITVGFRRLTGPGLRDIEALTAEGRRTLNDLSRTVRSIERNPSQVIFGGQSGLPEYQGRR